MINVVHNVYQPYWVVRMSLADLNGDAKQAMPVVIAFGNYRGTLQGNARFFEKKETQDALAAMDRQVELSVKCFTDLASANHELSSDQVKDIEVLIAQSCAGANIETSLDALKGAEDAATAAMDSERRAGPKK
jgi:hypothetical protein